MKYIKLFESHKDFNWTKDKCETEALKYKTISQFKRLSNSAYKYALKQDDTFYNKITSHMIVNNKLPRGYWTYERCIEYAKKCINIKEFSELYPGAYDRSLSQGYMDEIRVFLPNAGSLRDRWIYSYEFPDNSVYVGLTYNLDKRHNDHMTYKTSSVLKHIIELGIYPIRRILTDKSISPEEASKSEIFWINNYKERGFNILNKVVGGGLGSGIVIWTYDKCKEEALKYTTRGEFQKMSNSAYSRSIKEGWLDEICNHMNVIKNPKGYWTYERCKEEASKYTSKSEFRKGSSGAYDKSYTEGWLKEFLYK